MKIISAYKKRFFVDRIKHTGPPHAHVAKALTGPLRGINVTGTDEEKLEVDVSEEIRSNSVGTGFITSPVEQW